VGTLGEPSWDQPQPRRRHRPRCEFGAEHCRAPVLIAVAAFSSGYTVWALASDGDAIRAAAAAPALHPCPGSGADTSSGADAIPGSGSVWQCALVSAIPATSAATAGVSYLGRDQGVVLCASYRRCYLFYHFTSIICSFFPIPRLICLKSSVVLYLPRISSSYIICTIYCSILMPSFSIEILLSSLLRFCSFASYMHASSRVLYFAFTYRIRVLLHLILSPNGPCFFPSVRNPSHLHPFCRIQYTHISLPLFRCSSDIHLVSSSHILCFRLSCSCYRHMYHILGDPNQ
jgi:hypothetical protein